MQINKPYCCYGRNVHNQKYFEKAVSVYSITKINVSDFQRFVCCFLNAAFNHPMMILAPALNCCSITRTVHYSCSIEEGVNVFILCTLASANSKALRAKGRAMYPHVIVSL